MARTESITRSHLQQLLLLGLGLSAILLLSALLLAIRTVHQINTNTQSFANEEASAKAVIDDIQKQQEQLNKRWLRLARRKDALSRDEVLEQLSENRNQMNSALDSAYQQAELLRETIYQKGHGLLRWTVWLFAACVILSLIWATWTVRATTGLFGKLEQQAAELSRLQYQFLESQENVARRFSHELH
ncbi:MAG: hypothetical protein JO033_17065, partial [Acidobacteriaceae bacterium]|nr:hypothetical protein [Acidobacteriaceae bacterium]